MRAWIGRNWKNWTVFPLLMLLVTLFVYTNGCQTAKDTAVATAADSNLLTQPKVISAENGSLDTCLRIEPKDWLDTPTGLVLFEGSNPDNSTVINLRTYGSPPEGTAPGIDACGDGAQLDWTIPGPTYRVAHGDAINLQLINALPPVTEVEPPCDESGHAGYVPSLPNCFHGDNITNFHYHGFRVSPEPPQDWIYLKLRPIGSVDDPNSSVTFVGNYTFHVDPLLPIQAPGTHWYHPHKHGATAIQVVNGMAGAFLVEGEYDQAIKDQVPGIEEKVLVVQQIQNALAFYPNQPIITGQGFYVNGQFQPTIQMAPGEVQWWRFVGATQQIASQLILGFNQTGAPPLTQLAQDGVQFNQVNFERQPLNLNSPDTFLTTALWTGKPPERDHLTLTTGLLDADANALFQLAPGNRMDLLVKAPLDQTGVYDLIAEQIALNELGQVAKDTFGQGGGQILLTLNVTGANNPMGDFTTVAPFPSYLNDISNIGFNTTVAFSMNPAQPPSNTDPPAEFFIDDKKFDPTRIDHQVYLTRNETWKVTNNTTIPHPFHIHVNPFQITKLNGRPLTAPWVWWDTFAIPVPFNATPQGPLVDGSYTMDQRFLEFTGEYVLHCHILGHEDRGMMQNVCACENESQNATECCPRDDV